MACISSIREYQDVDRGGEDADSGKGEDDDKEQRAQSNDIIDFATTATDTSIPYSVRNGKPPS